MILIITKKPSPPQIDFANPIITETLKYRDKWERIARLTVIPLGVFEEELVLRGYLVLFLGGLTGNYFLWAMISIILTVVVHLYQGLNFRTIATHLLYAGLFVGLIILTKNILAPIAVHLFINFQSFLKIWTIAEKQEEPISKPIHSGRKKLAYLVFIITNIAILFALAVIAFLKFEEPPDFGGLFSFNTLFVFMSLVLDYIF